MGRDLRIIGFNRNLYPDKCYLYDSKAVNHNKLVQDATPICRFYKKDVVPFHWEKAQVGNGTTSSRRQFIGTIETADHVEKARPDMYVVDQTGTLFIIEDALVNNDLDRTKVVGTRPAVITQIVLKGLTD